MPRSQESRERSAFLENRCRLGRFPVGFARGISSRPEGCSRVMSAVEPVPSCADGVMMGSRGGHALAESSNRGLAQRARAAPRAFLRLEMLETRCLLSGWPQIVGPDPDRLLAMERPASDVAWIRDDGLNVPDAGPRRPGNSARLNSPQVRIPMQITSEGPTGSPDVTPGPRVCRKSTMSSFPRPPRLMTPSPPHRRSPIFPTSEWSARSAPGMASTSTGSRSTAFPTDSISVW